MSEPWSIPGSDGQPILGDTHRPAGPAIGTLLLCHGFKGYKDYGFFPQLAEAAAERGMVAHRFNFSHSGMTSNVATFARPELFERDTWSKQIADLTAVAQASAAGELPGDAPDLPHVWFGHSRGGITVLLTAARVLESASVPEPAALVAAATPDCALNLDEQQRQQLRRDGSLESPSGRTGQRLRIGSAWLTEIEADPDAFDPCLAIERLECPVLIVHGDADETVPLDAARHLANACGEAAQLLLLPGATHTFNAPNPLPLDATPPALTQRFIDAVVTFASERARSAAA